MTTLSAVDGHAVARSIRLQKSEIPDVDTNASATQSSADGTMGAAEAHGRLPESERQHGDLQYRLILRPHVHLNSCRRFQCKGIAVARVCLYEAGAYGCYALSILAKSRPASED